MVMSGSWRGCPAGSRCGSGVALHAVPAGLPASAADGYPAPDATHAPRCAGWRCRPPRARRSWNLPLGRRGPLCCRSRCAWQAGAGVARRAAQPDGAMAALPRLLQARAGAAHQTKPIQRCAPSCVAPQPLCRRTQSCTCPTTRACRSGPNSGRRSRRSLPAIAGSPRAIPRRGGWGRRLDCAGPGSRLAACPGRRCRGVAAQPAVIAQRPMPLAVRPRSCWTCRAASSCSLAPARRCRRVWASGWRWAGRGGKRGGCAAGSRRAPRMRCGAAPAAAQPLPPGLPLARCLPQSEDEAACGGGAESDEECLLGRLKEAVQVQGTGRRRGRAVAGGGEEPSRQRRDDKHHQLACLQCVAPGHGCMPCRRSRWASRRSLPPRASWREAGGSGGAGGITGHTKTARVRRLAHACHGF